MHQASHAGVDRRDHRRAAHRVHVDLHAYLLGFVDDRLEYVDLCLRRRRLRCQPDLTGVPDALGGQRLNRCPRLRRRLTEVDLAGRNDARADELALVDAVAQRDVGVGLPAAGEDSGVARLEQRPHLPRRVLAVVHVLVAVDEAGHGAHALGVDRRAGPASVPRRRVTETILPPRTMIVPDSITWPLPTITRALVMATSCALARVGAINPVTARHADTNCLFICPHSC